MKTESSANGRRPHGRDLWPFEIYVGSSLLKADRQLERMSLKHLASFHTPLTLPKEAAQPTLILPQSVTEPRSRTATSAELGDVPVWTEGCCLGTSELRATISVPLQTPQGCAKAALAPLPHSTQPARRTLSCPLVAHCLTTCQARRRPLIVRASF